MCGHHVSSYSGQLGTDSLELKWREEHYPSIFLIKGHTASEAYLYVTEQEAGHTLDRLQVYCSDNVEREFRITNLT